MRHAALKGRLPAHVRIRRIVARSPRILIVPAARRRVVIRAPDWRAVASVVVVPARASVTVVLAITTASRAVTPRVGTAFIVIHGRAGLATRAKRAATISSSELGRGAWGASDALSLKLAIVELVNRSPQIGSSLKLDNAFTISGSVNFAEDNVQARSTSKIFQILDERPCKSKLGS